MRRPDSLQFKDGDTIFREGDPGDCAFLIESGNVAFYIVDQRGEQTLNIAGAGEIFGEISLIDAFPRSASCRAMGDVQLLAITKEQLTQRIESSDPMIRLIMSNFMQRLRRNVGLLRGENPEKISLNEKFDTEKSEVANKIELENRIFKAVSEDKFVPYYQPIFDLRTRKVIGCEALIRWTEAAGRMVPPSVFMDILENSAGILRVGNQMFTKCLRDLSELRAGYHAEKDFFISINVSGRQFIHPSFLSELESIRAKSGAEAKYVKLEITERIMMDGPQVLNVLAETVKAGYRLAIDDFGTGFSSLQYLAAMPLHDLKIDRAFVRQMMEDGRYLSIVKSLVHMADQLSLNVIAEGIETEAELAVLKELGVYQGQGFLFSPAVPLTEFLKYEDSRKKKTA